MSFIELPTNKTSSGVKTVFTDLFPNIISFAFEIVFGPDYPFKLFRPIRFKQHVVCANV